MTARLIMTTRRRFGISNRALLNPALVEAIHGSVASCEVCREIEKDLDAIPDGGEFVEAASFPGKTVLKLDAHFRAHWKDEYEMVDVSGRRDAPSR